MSSSDEDFVASFTEIPHDEINRRRFILLYRVLPMVQALLTFVAWLIFIFGAGGCKLVRFSSSVPGSSYYFGPDWYNVWVTDYYEYCNFYGTDEEYTGRTGITKENVGFDAKVKVVDAFTWISIVFGIPCMALAQIQMYAGLNAQWMSWKAGLCIATIMPLFQGMLFFVLSSAICIDNPFMKKKGYSGTCEWGKGLRMVTASIVLWFLSGSIIIAVALLSNCNDERFLRRTAVSDTSSDTDPASDSVPGETELRSIVQQ
jgi:hypothetical protein